MKGVLPRNMCKHLIVVCTILLGETLCDQPGLVSHFFSSRRGTNSHVRCSCNNRISSFIGFCHSSFFLDCFGVAPRFARGIAGQTSYLAVPPSWRFNFHTDFVIAIGEFFNLLASSRIIPFAVVFISVVIDNLVRRCAHYGGLECRLVLDGTLLLNVFGRLCWFTPDKPRISTDVDLPRCLMQEPVRLMFMRIPNKDHLLEL